MLVGYQGRFPLNFFSVVLVDEQSALYLSVRGKRDCITYSERSLRFRSRKFSTLFDDRASANAFIE